MDKIELQNQIKQLQNQLEDIEIEERFDYLQNQVGKTYKVIYDDSTIYYRIIDYTDYEMVVFEFTDSMTPYVNARADYYTLPSDAKSITEKQFFNTWHKFNKKLCAIAQTRN
jgi:hypothetical protein